MVLLTLFALVAGAATAVTPCVLPVLPALLSASATGGRRRTHRGAAHAAGEVRAELARQRLLERARGWRGAGFRLYAVRGAHPRRGYLGERVRGHVRPAR